MSDIGIVVAAHAPLASALCATAREILGEGVVDDGRLRWAEVEPRASAADTFERLSNAIAAADQGDGVLLLADLFGGSAANVALAYLGEQQVEVVTGVNLPMVLEALTHASTCDTPAALARRVAEAAQQSVVVAGALLETTPSLRRESEASV